MNVIECACTSFYIICITNAVVCGGMLAVMNVACCIRTRKPGTSLENGTVLPAGFKITVSGVIWNSITEEGFWLLMVVIVWLRKFVSTIRPVVVSKACGRLTTRMRNAWACGGILLVMAEENVASITIPTSNSLAGIGAPFSLRITVSLFITNTTCWFPRLHVGQLP